MEGQQVIDDILVYWQAACQHDVVEINAKFVEFSVDNPWLEKYQQVVGEWLVMQQLQEAMR